MRTAAIIQARMGSVRLPGKVLLPLAGRPVLAHVIERVRACTLVHEVVVATTDRPRDGVVVELARSLGVRPEVAAGRRRPAVAVLSVYSVAAAGRTLPAGRMVVTPPANRATT